MISSETLSNNFFFRLLCFQNSIRPLPLLSLPLSRAGSDQRTWTVADSESPSAASACSVLEGRRPGTGGSSSGGVTSDGPSTPATEGISTTVLASPVTGFSPHQLTMECVDREGDQYHHQHQTRQQEVEGGGDSNAMGVDVTGK